MPEPHDTVILFSPVRRPEPKTWRVVRRELDGEYGTCDTADRVIELCSKIEGRQLVDTALHEAAHAACPDLAEAAILRLVRCQLSLLAHLGIVATEGE